MNEILTPEHIEPLLKLLLVQDENTLLAFDCINEIMARNFVPREYNQFMIQVLFLSLFHH